MPAADHHPAPPAFDRLFRVAAVAIPLGVLANVAISLLGTDRTLLASLDELPRGYLLIGVVLTLVPWLSGTLRLLLWTRFLGHPLPMREAVRITLAVDLGAALSPTAVGGEAFKWGLLVRRGMPPGTAASLALLPKVEDGIFFAFALPVALVISAPWRMPAVRGLAGQVPGELGAVVVIGVVILLLSWIGVRLLLGGALGRPARWGGLRFLARIRRRFGRTWDDARAVYREVWRRGKGRMAVALALTAMHWIARYSVVIALFAFLAVPVDPVLVWALQWLVFTLMSFVPSPGAAGGAEAAFSLVHATLLPAGVLGLATAGWRLLTFYVPVALAAVLFPLLEARRRA